MQGLGLARCLNECVHNHYCVPVENRAGRPVSYVFFCCYLHCCLSAFSGIMMFQFSVFIASSISLGAVH